MRWMHSWGLEVTVHYKVVSVENLSLLKGNWWVPISSRKRMDSLLRSSHSWLAFWECMLLPGLENGDVWEELLPRAWLESWGPLDKACWCVDWGQWSLFILSRLKRTQNCEENLREDHNLCKEDIHLNRSTKNRQTEEEAVSHRRRLTHWTGEMEATENEKILFLQLVPGSPRFPMGLTFLFLMNVRSSLKKSSLLFSLIMPRLECCRNPNSFRS